MRVSQSVVLSVELMTFLSVILARPVSVALSPLAAAPRSKRNWAIPYRAIAPVAMAVDGLIIFATSILSGVAYHLEFRGHRATCNNSSGLQPLLQLCSSLWQAVAISTTCRHCSISNRKFATSRLNGASFFFFSRPSLCDEDRRQLFARLAIVFAASGLVALLLARVVWRIFLSDEVAVRKFSGRRIALIADEHYRMITAS